MHSVFQRSDDIRSVILTLAPEVERSALASVDLPARLAQGGVAQDGQIADADDHVARLKPGHLGGGVGLNRLEPCALR